jgi:transposase
VFTVGEIRKSYNEEFKQQTVKYIQQQTKTIPQLALELDISTSTLHQWLGKYRKFESEPLVDSARIKELEQQLREKDRELAAKERDLADARETAEILKKAMHIFSKTKD